MTGVQQYNRCYYRVLWETSVCCRSGFMSLLVCVTCHHGCLVGCTVHLTLRFPADRLHAVCVQSEVRYNLVGYFPGTIYFTLNTVTGDIVLRQSFANDLYSSLLYVVSCVPSPLPALVVSCVPNSLPALSGKLA